MSNNACRDHWLPSSLRRHVRRPATKKGYTSITTTTIDRYDTSHYCTTTKTHAAYTCPSNPPQHTPDHCICSKQHFREMESGLLSLLLLKSRRCTTRLAIVKAFLAVRCYYRTETWLFQIENQVYTEIKGHNNSDGTLVLQFRCKPDSLHMKSQGVSVLATTHYCTVFFFKVQKSAGFMILRLLHVCYLSLLSAADGLTTKIDQ